MFRGLYYKLGEWIVFATLYTPCYYQQQSLNTVAWALLYALCRTVAKAGKWLMNIHEEAATIERQRDGTIVLARGQSALKRRIEKFKLLAKTSFPQKIFIFKSRESVFCHIVSSKGQ